MLSGDLDTIILMALRKEPDRRYGSVEQFAEDVRRFLGGLPVMASPDTIRYRTSKFVRRHWAGITAVLGILLTLIAGIVVSLALYVESENQRALAERRFKDVRSLATSLLFDVHDAVAPLEGSTEARAFIVSSATDYLDELAGEAGDDLTLREELAGA